MTAPLTPEVPDGWMSILIPEGETAFTIRPDQLRDIIEALMDAADRRRERGKEGGLHWRIADGMDDLAVALHEAQPGRLVLS